MSKVIYVTDSNYKDLSKKKLHQKEPVNDVITRLLGKTVPTRKRICRKPKTRP